VLQQLGQPQTVQAGVVSQAEGLGQSSHPSVEVTPTTGQQGITGYGEQPGLPEPKKVRLAGLEGGRIA